MYNLLPFPTSQGCCAGINALMASESIQMCGVTESKCEKQMSWNLSAPQSRFNWVSRMTAAGPGLSCSIFASVSHPNQTVNRRISLISCASESVKYTLIKTCWTEKRPEHNFNPFNGMNFRLFPSGNPDILYCKWKVVSHETCAVLDKIVVERLENTILLLFLVVPSVNRHVELTWNLQTECTGRRRNK